MKELEAKREQIVKQASSVLKQAAAELRAFTESQKTEPEKVASRASEPSVDTTTTDLEALKQAFLQQIAESDAELARLEAEGK